jgi:recombination associated protein RdgC
MNLELKAAIVYKAEIPVDNATLNEHLQIRAFTPPGTMQLTSNGFVPPVDDGDERLAREFTNGIVMSVRVDEKVIPPQVIREETTKACKAVETLTGRKPGKKERAEIKEGVLLKLLEVAMVRTVAVVPCYYHTATGYLIVATTSKRIADIATSLMVHAVGSMKTETIHVSDVKHGLTTRLKNWLIAMEDEVEPSDGEIGFGKFEPVDTVSLALSFAEEPARKITVQMGDLSSARTGLLDALQKGFSVKSLGLADSSLTFTLTDDFRMKAIEFPVVESYADDEDYGWASGCTLQVDRVVDAISTMCEMLSYKAPEAEQAEEGKAQEEDC